MTKYLVRITVALLAVATAAASSMTAREHLLTWLALGAAGVFFLGLATTPFIAVAQGVARRRGKKEYAALSWVAIATQFSALTTIYVSVLLWKTQDAQAVVCALLVPLLFWNHPWLAPPLRRIAAVAAAAVVAAAPFLLDRYWAARAIPLALLAAAGLPAIWSWLKNRTQQPRPDQLLSTASLVMVIVSVFFFAGLQRPDAPDATAPCKLLLRTDAVRAMIRQAGGAPGRSGPFFFLKGGFYDLKTDAATHVLFFSDSAEQRVGAIDLVSKKVTLSPGLGDAPEQLILTEERRELVTYVKGKLGIKITMVFDPITLRTRIHCGVGNFVDLAATPIAGVLAGVKEYRPYFYRMEPDKCLESKTHIGTAIPYQVLCARRSPRCYVSGWYASRTLTAIDLAPDGSPAAQHELVLGAFSTSMALDEERGLLYVSRPFAGGVDVVDTRQLRRVRRIPAPTMVRAIAIAPELDLLFLPTYFDSVVEVRQLSTGKYLGQFPVGKYVREIVWDPDLRTLFIASSETIFTASVEDLSAWLHRLPPPMPTPTPSPTAALAPVAFGMIHLPGGTFLMGCSPGDGDCAADERPAHRVTLKSFWIDAAETTNEQYAGCVHAGACTDLQYAGEARQNGATLPVVKVDWHQAAAYCRWIRGRLPTEAEWEYAARAGTTGPRHGRLDDIAWHAGDSGGVIHPVGQKQPNAWGLYDMLGNAWEWTADRYDENYYRSSPAANPPGPLSGASRVLRGGSWGGYPGNLRASYRTYGRPSLWGSGVGFRCARD
jgi:formylglycine-generating enzyme required for sulfatase activity